MDGVRRWVVWTCFVAVSSVLPSQSSAQAPAADAGAAAPEPGAAPPAPAPDQPVPIPAPEAAPAPAVEPAAPEPPVAAPESAVQPEQSTDLLASPGPKHEDVMIVTGSRIKRTSFDTPTPVQVVDREQIARSGASNMADLIRVLTANSGSETQFGLGNGSTGSSQFNLRGLGIANTLVLLNGRRLVSFPDAFGVDQQRDVRRREPDSARRSSSASRSRRAAPRRSTARTRSPAWSTSSCARTSKARRSTSAARPPTSWDQQDGEVAAIFGARSEKSSVVAQISYFQRAPLAAKDREFTKGTLTSTVGQPGTFILPDFSGAGGPTQYHIDEGCGAAGTDSYVDGANPATPERRSLSLRLSQRLEPVQQGSSASSAT